jgi:hypothetical protein
MEPAIDGAELTEVSSWSDRANSSALAGIVHAWWVPPRLAAAGCRRPPLCGPALQAFAGPELVEGQYASEDTLHSSAAFLRNTLRSEQAALPGGLA